LGGSQEFRGGRTVKMVFVWENEVTTKPTVKLKKTLETLTGVRKSLCTLEAGLLRLWSLLGKNRLTRVLKPFNKKRRCSGGESPTANRARKKCYKPLKWTKQMLIGKSKKENGACR